MNVSFINKIKVGLLCSVLIPTFSCKKFVETDVPYISISADNIYTNDAMAASVLTGIYINLSRSNSTGFNTGGVSSLSLFPSLSADELTLNNLNDLTYLNYYQNSLTSTPSVGTADYWSSFYPVIYQANAAIEGLEKSNSLTAPIKQQLQGEAKFIRALCYFYLVNLYGDVPLVTSTDYKVNAELGRTPKDQVYQLIIDDLKNAQTLLNDKYLMSDALTAYSAGSEQRVRPTKAAATSLLARVYLYTGNNWSDAEAQATAVISNNILYDTVSLNNVFLKNNKEAIWQLQAVGSGTNSNTGEGKRFILPATGPSTSFPVHLSNTVVNSFEVGDKRKISWVGSVTPTPPGTITYYYPNKYKIGAVNTTAQEFCTVLRLAEVYLIRAEARAQLNNVTGSQSDLNVIRKRAGLSNTTANDKTSLLSAILHERQVELFTEWGHRWLDLKRTNTIDAVMTPAAIAKGGAWQTTDQLYPILQSELSKSPNVVQNPGY